MKRSSLKRDSLFHSKKLSEGLCLVGSGGIVSPRAVSRIVLYVWTFKSPRVISSAGHFGSFVRPGFSSSPPRVGRAESLPSLQTRNLSQKTPCVSGSCSLTCSLICQHEDNPSAVLFWGYVCLYFYYLVSLQRHNAFDPALITAGSSPRHKHLFYVGVVY